MIFIKLFLTFFKIGAFTFGGGYAMLPLIQEAVAAEGWMSSEALINFIAVSESTPGPLAVNMATFVGTETAGFFGAFFATLGVVLPSFIVILIVAKIFDKFKKSKIVNGCMSGLKPAVIGLISTAALTVAKTVFIPDGFSLSLFSDAEFYVCAGIFIISLLLALKKTHPILIICLSALFGIICGYAL